MSEPFMGEIRMVGFNFAPTGWAFCQGQIMSIAQNSALFALLGTQFGGNGQTTFALPDLRSRSPVGMGQGPGLSNVAIGEVGGVENVTLTNAELPTHVHGAAGMNASVAIPVNTTVGTTTTPANTSVLSQTVDSEVGAIIKLYAPGPGTTTLQPFNAGVTGTTSPAGSNMPLGIRNPFLGINCIIAMEGLFPSRS